MILLKDIEVRFGDFTALKDINIHVEEGQFYTFLGPSGCGKTTTLRTITGFIEPAAGTVTVKGKDITHVPVERRNIGMVFQNYALFPTMSVYENIAFGLRVKKVNKTDMDRRVKEMAQKVDLTESQLMRKVDELSGGRIVLAGHQERNRFRALHRLGLVLSVVDAHRGGDCVAVHVDSRRPAELDRQTLRLRIPDRYGTGLFVAREELKRVRAY